MDYASEIEILKTQDLIAYENNARTHTDEQIAKIAKSIESFGFVNPVIITDDNMIIAGHGRVAAARLAGISEIPCVRASHLTQEQARAYIIADNRLAEDAGWDREILSEELAELAGLDFDISYIGFEEGEINSLLDPPEALDIGEPEAAIERGKTCCCPKCGFEFRLGE